MRYVVTVKIEIAADSQGEALAELEKRVRDKGAAGPIIARVVETVNIKEAN